MLSLRKYRIMRKILDLFAFKDFGKTTTTKKQCNINNVVRSHPFDKHYHDMSRKEKRAYKKWLYKNNMWDGAIVIENLERDRKLFYEE
jgi:hypothetical protein